MIDLKGRIALVTGGSRGIGRVVAVALAEAGADVAVNYQSREREASAVVDAISALGRRAVAIAADVAKRPAVAAMVAEIEATLGPIDVLVNNAGVAEVRGLDDLTEEDFDETIATNLKSAYLCTAAILPGMRARRWGRIVNVSSSPPAPAARSASTTTLRKPGSRDSREGTPQELRGRRDYRQRRRARPHRHRDGGAPESRRPRGAHPHRPLRRGGGSRGGRDDAGGERVHDRPDHRRERRAAVRIGERMARFAHQNSL